MITLTTDTSLDALACKFLADVLDRDNYGASKGHFLTGDNVLVCEDRGLQQYLQKKCADTSKRRIWTALPFKPLAGVLIQYAYSVLPPEKKASENANIFKGENLVWAVYRLLTGSQQTYNFANEIANLFTDYQLYRPDMIAAWNNGKSYTFKDADDSFRNNEAWQREIWQALRRDHDKNEEMDIAGLYQFLQENDAGKEMGRRIFIFAPRAIAPVHLATLSLMARAGRGVNLYLLAPSNAYTRLEQNGIAEQREKAWQNDKIAGDSRLYWEIGSPLAANLGRAAQVLHEQIAGCEGVTTKTAADENQAKPATPLLEKLRRNILNENNKDKDNTPLAKDDSIVFNNCFSPLREIEALRDYLLDLFVKDPALKPDDIAVLAPNIDKFASAIEIVFGRKADKPLIPYRIADRDVRKYDKTAQLLALLFTEIGGGYEASHIAQLFEYSRFVRDQPLDPGSRDLLDKWINENAIRRGLDSNEVKPDYTFKTGLGQLAAGFFMIAENGFSENGDYCYPDIEGAQAHILGDFAWFVNSLRTFQDQCFDDNGNEREKTIDEWDAFLWEHLPAFFGEDETDFNEDEDNPYQMVMASWDALKKEMSTGFGNYPVKLHFTVIKEALQKALEKRASSSYSISGALSFSNIATLRAVPRKVLCFIGMNSGDFPVRQTRSEIDLIAAGKRLGDKDAANEDRLMFLEGILSAEEKLYISWTGQSEKTAEELEPSSVVIMLLKNLEEQYGVDVKEMVTRHPLQPFSRKYFDGSIAAGTYDDRWNTTAVKPSAQNLWQWRMDQKDGAESAADEDTGSRSASDLYRIFKDAAKYFLRDVCSIELPGEAASLEDTEPFVVEKGLDEWKLADLILKKDEKNLDNEIKIAQYRGEFPYGAFADKIIAKKKEEIEEMENLEDPAIETFIRPSKDRGDYRLWHWLHHLEKNVETENTPTTMILFNKDKKPIQLILAGLSKGTAVSELARLWDMADGLKTRMLPIFPNAAWAYYQADKSNGEKEKKAIDNAEFDIFGDGDFNEGIAKYSQYAKMVLGDAESFEDLQEKSRRDIKKEFIEYSNRLFGNCKWEEVK